VTKLQQIIHRSLNSLQNDAFPADGSSPNDGRRLATSVSDTITVLEVVTGSPEETEALAARLAGLLRAGDVVAVSGELGAGKTTFVRGAARALGVREPVSSPTFTIGHRYDAPVPVAHLDLYRTAGIGPEEWADLEPYFDGTVAFVEWPEHGGHWLPEIRATVTLNHVDESRRQVSIDSEDDLGL
jgi:tRNA threonylcarbamoyladenosine biosynthesis protein TsaE